MDLNDLSQSSLALLPTLLTLGLALTTRRILLSLLLGSATGAWLLVGSLDAPRYLAGKALALFYDGGISWWTLQVVGFLLMLGALSRLLQASGAAQAFAEACASRIATRRGVSLMSVGLGLAIFIDDYFNALAVGQATRPLADRYRLSRERLAYYIDSTAAPVCALMPLSSWGAFMLSLLAPMAASPMGLFVDMSQAAFYPWLALVIVLITAWFDWDLGAMKKAKARPGAAAEVQTAKGQLMPLLGPLLALILVTLAALFITGALASSGPFSAIAALENTNVGLSLVLGAVPALAWSFFKQKTHRLAAAWEGAKTMLPAIYLLLSAWLLAAVMKDVAVGRYLASLIEAASVGPWMPLALFVVAMVMALATGSSWGTFGIMLPLAGQLVEPAMLPMALGAVISGAVFGDHCSPASDTTILSSAGAECEHMDHVLTQLPYAGLAAGLCVLGYGLSALALPLWALWGALLAALVVAVTLLGGWGTLAPKKQEV